MDPQMESHNNFQFSDFFDSTEKYDQQLIFFFWTPTWSGKNTHSHLVTPVLFLLNVHSKNACAVERPKLGNISTIASNRMCVFLMIARLRPLLVQCLTSSSLLPTRAGIMAATAIRRTVGRKDDTMPPSFSIWPAIDKLLIAVTIN